MKLDRAIIGVDGDHAFALLGPDIQEGEAEFVLIDSDLNEHPNRYHSSDWCKAADRASRQALSNLRKRLGRTTKDETWITYALDSSHPTAR